MKSARLKRMPKNIIIIDPHNFANVGTNLAKSLSTRFTVKYICPTNPGTKKRVEMIFSLPPNDTFIIIIEPGDLAYKPNIPSDYYLYPSVIGVQRPTNIPWGLFWCGTVCRIKNYSIQPGIKPKHERYLKRRRNYFNSLTPIRMCATEDLSKIGIGSTYVGQPLKFPVTLPKKNIEKHSIIHVPTSPNVTDHYKGTARIVSAFEKLPGDIHTSVVKWKTENNKILKMMRASTMFAGTLTNWDYGTGYTVIEALSRGCLVFTRQSKYKIKDSPLINVDDPDELVEKVKYYANNTRAYNTKRKKQFIWGRSHFSNEAVANKIYNEMKRTIRRVGK